MPSTGSSLDTLAGATAGRATGKGAICPRCLTQETESAEVQTREGQHQRLQRLQVILRENQGSQEIRLPKDIFERVLQDERRLEQEWQAEERRLQGESTAVHEALEGLPRERLREQLRQRVDDVLRGQPSREQLRNEMLELRGSVLRDYCELEPQQNRLFSRIPRSYGGADEASWSSRAGTQDYPGGSDWQRTRTLAAMKHASF